jgi:hypothetical protein
MSGADWHDTEEVTMAERTPKSGSRPGKGRTRRQPHGSRDEIRQPEMSQPQGDEPQQWLVPDTRDDIVVSHWSDF